METKRLIVSTNYINLHARERERGRKKEFKGKERFMKNKERRRKQVQGFTTTAKISRTLFLVT